MSESSTDKTTRKILSAMEEYEWVQQVSIFYLDYNDRFLAAEHKPEITRRLRRMFPNQAFLYRLRLNRAVDANKVYGYEGESNSVSLPYHSFFTNCRLDRQERLDFVVALETVLDCELKHVCTTPSRLRRYLWLKTLKREKVDDLASYFPSLKSQRRWAFLNKGKATPRAS